MHFNGFFPSIFILMLYFLKLLDVIICFNSVKIIFFVLHLFQTDLNNKAYKKQPKSQIVCTGYNKYNNYKITSMGNNYQNFPKQAPLPFNPQLHEFESTNVQRIKQTPFSWSQVYSIQPPIFMDSVGIRIRQIIQPRVSTHQLFPPTQILKIAENIVHGLLELQERGFQAHGDVSTETIYYDKRQKLFKLTHPIFSPESAYKQSVLKKRFSLLSPEQLLCLTDPSQKQKNITSIKSDLFTLGIILCEISTLLPSNQIYCPDTYVIFDKEIQNRIELIKQYYGGESEACNKIVKVLGFLLEYDQDARKDCKEIEWMLGDAAKSAGGVAYIRTLPPGTLLSN